eukprot:3972825-Amphidinium_carterae.1
MLHVEEAAEECPDLVDIGRSALEVDEQMVRSISQRAGEQELTAFVREEVSKQYAVERDDWTAKVHEVCKLMRPTCV